MIVNGKFVNYDLSRFKNCTIKRAALCDLMGIPEFVKALEAENEFAVSDQWVAKIVNSLVTDLRMSREEKRSLSQDEIKNRQRQQTQASNVMRLIKKSGIAYE